MFDRYQIGSKMLEIPLLKKLGSPKTSPGVLWSSTAKNRKEALTHLWSIIVDHIGDKWWQSGKDLALFLSFINC